MLLSLLICVCPKGSTVIGIPLCTTLSILEKLAIINPHASAGGLFVVGLFVCQLCKSVCTQVFSRTVAAADIKHGDMDKYHGSSVQQDVL